MFYTPLLYTIILSVCARKITLSSVSERYVLIIVGFIIEMHLAVYKKNWLLSICTTVEKELILVFISNKSFYFPKKFYNHLNCNYFKKLYIRSCYNYDSTVSLIMKAKSKHPSTARRTCQYSRMQSSRALQKYMVKNYTA